MSFCLFIHLLLCIYSFCRGCIYNFKVWNTLTQLYHNARNFLRNKLNLNNFQILLQSLLSKTYWWKNTPLSKVLICYERNFHQEVALKFEDEVWSYFPFLQITFKISLIHVNVYIHWLAMLTSSSKDTWSGQAYFCCKFQLFTISPLYPHARRLLERQSHNNNLKLKAYNFLRVFFSRKFPSTQ